MTAVQINGSWTCAGFTEGDAVIVKSCIAPSPQRGTLVAILHPHDKRPEPRVNLESGNSWQGPFDAMIHSVGEGVERVARAICAKEYEDPATYWGDTPIPQAVDKDWPDYIETALSAIAAMRQCTLAMLVAGEKNIFDSRDDPHTIWNAMIDEALK